MSSWGNQTPGLATAVLKNGEIVYSKNVGLANLEYDIPIETNTVFHAASLSKQFTAFTILVLESQGKLSLQDDIRDYLPEVPDFGKKITLLNLANHTSGLRDQWRLLELSGWQMDDVIKTDHILTLIAKQKELNFNPGDRFMYSNTGYTLLAEIVKRVSGKTFASFVKEQIFEPLEMRNSLFYDDYERIVPNRAYSYQNTKNGDYKKLHLNFNTVGATSLFTTANDLMKWAKFLNSPPKDMVEIVNKLNEQTYLNNGDKLESALGQFTGVKYKGMQWFDHSGSDAGYRAYLGRFPESNSAVVVLANSIPISAGGTALRIANPFLEEYFEEVEPSNNSINRSKNQAYYSGDLPTNLSLKF